MVMKPYMNRRSFAASPILDILRACLSPYVHADPCSAVEQQLRFWVAANRNKRQTLTCATINSIYLPLPPPQPPQPLNHPPPPFSFLAVFAFDIGFFFSLIPQPQRTETAAEKNKYSREELGKGWIQ